jgi:hypothetical protein
MRAALLFLLKDTERYIITVKRPRFNWETGRDQSPGLTLYENDGLDLSTAIDTKLSRSRRVQILLTDKEKGTCQINLTARSWEIWTDSSALRDKLITFNQRLIAGAHSRIITSWNAGFILLTPVWSALILVVIWSLSTRRGRQLGFDTNSPAGQAAFNKAVPQWIDNFEHTMFALWPVFLAISLAIWSVIAMAGGLQIWPEKLTFKSAAQSLYRVRASTITPATATAIIVGVVSAVIGAVVTWWLTRLYCLAQRKPPPGRKETGGRFSPACPLRNLGETVRRGFRDLATIYRATGDDQRTIPARSGKSYRPAIVSRITSRTTTSVNRSLISASHSPITRANNSMLALSPAARAFRSRSRVLSRASWSWRTVHFPSTLRTGVASHIPVKPCPERVGSSKRHAPMVSRQG